MGDGSEENLLRMQVQGGYHALVLAGSAACPPSCRSTWIFVLAYLLVWTGFGALAFGAASVATEFADRSPWLMDNATRIGGLRLLAAGLYQLTPLKRACLSKCRTPLDFVLGRWRDGYSGTLRMGVEHGV